MKDLIDKLYKNNNITEEELLYLLNNIDDYNLKYLNKKALETQKKVYKNKVYIRGLIEFTNYCKRNCMYCGIRHENYKADRYRLSKSNILSVCNEGYKLGYRTFVLQGGEDDFYTDSKILDLVKSIKNKFQDVAITLSIGEKSYDSYKKYYDAGVDRYLLRHETASEELYKKLHPKASFKNRINCLWNLKKIGYQVGAGFMVGLPNATNEDYVKDIMFLKELNPEMVGIGPFIPHNDTPLGKNVAGTLKKTITFLSITRLILPEVLLPSTTALGSIHPFGTEEGLRAGANVIMLNLLPADIRRKYALYNVKIDPDYEIRQYKNDMEQRIIKAGFSVDMSRGDNINWTRN